MLASFLSHNKTLKHIDLSKNCFNDNGFTIFAQNVAFNKGLVSLDISKNKDLSDEDSLVTLS